MPMDALAAQHPDAGAAARAQTAFASTADVFKLGARDSFIRPSNVISIADWRRRRRAAR